MGFDNLPTELKYEIFSKLPAKNMVQMCNVNRNCRDIVNRMTSSESVRSEVSRAKADCVWRKVLTDQHVDQMKKGYC